MKDHLITKKSGEVERFDIHKLKRSLQRSGASDIVIDEVVKQVVEELYPEIPTYKIYNKAYDLLGRSSRPSAAKYKLKQALFELGPSGFPFEKYVAKILYHLGFEVTVGKVINGKCVSHEMDVIAIKDDVCRLVECKFHNDDGNHCNVHVPLYLHARFNDIIQSTFSIQRNYEFEGWIVTNTRFTDDAVKYGECVGIHLVGWDYPSKGNLKELIDLAGLHPLTCLASMDKLTKEKYLSEGYVLCRDVVANEKLLSRTKNKNVILEEAKAVCAI